MPVLWVCQVRLPDLSMSYLAKRLFNIGLTSSAFSSNFSLLAFNFLCEFLISVTAIAITLA